jgi:hypothetical protein
MFSVLFCFVEAELEVEVEHEAEGLSIIDFEVIGEFPF